MTLLKKTKKNKTTRLNELNIGRRETKAKQKHSLIFVENHPAVKYNGAWSACSAALIRFSFAGIIMTPMFI